MQRRAVVLSLLKNHCIPLSSIFVLSMFPVFSNLGFLSEFSSPSTSRWEDFHQKLPAWLVPHGRSLVRVFFVLSLLYLRRAPSGTGYVATRVSWDDIFQNANGLTLIFFTYIEIHKVIMTFSPPLSAVPTEYDPSFSTHCTGTVSHWKGDILFALCLYQYL